jgi:hypothetical protein
MRFFRCTAFRSGSVSDKFSHRPFSGNFQSDWEHPTRQIGYRGPRRLVEECTAISIRDVRRAFGKKLMIAAIRQARPLRLAVLGGNFDIWPTDEPHRLPCRPERWSSLEHGNCRLWLICTGCKRKVGKLYYYYRAPNSMALSELVCRPCHGLVYQAQNCGGNKWYRQVARPLKRLLRKRAELLAKPHTPRIEAHFAQIESAISILRGKLQPKTQRRREGLSSSIRSSQRRPYRNLALLDPTIGGIEPSVRVPRNTEARPF